MGTRRAAVVAALLLAACSSSAGDDGTSTSSTSSAVPSVDDAVTVELSPLLGRPSAVAVADGVVWVADDGRGVVVRLDAADGRELGDPVPVSAAPVALAIADGTLWVADAQGTVTPVDIASGQPGESVFVGGTLVDVVADATTVWVADIERSRAIPIDTSGRSRPPPIEIPAGVVRLAVTADRLWATNLDSTVTAVDLSSGRVEEPTPVGRGPIGLAVRDGTVWVANGDDDTVTRIDEATGALLGEPIAVGPAPVDVVVAGEDVWVVEQDGRSISRLDAATGGVVLRSEGIGVRPRGVGAGSAGVWVVGVDPSAAVLVMEPG